MQDEGESIMPANYGISQQIADNKSLTAKNLMDFPSKKIIEIGDLAGNQTKDEELVDRDNIRGMYTLNQKELSLDEKVEFYNRNENFL